MTQPANPRKIDKTIVIRPGALGDVLVVMPTLRFIKDVLKCTRLALIAPAARGAFLARENWADEAFDWDSSLFAPLFHDCDERFPDRLREIFSGADLVVSLAGSGDTKKDGAFAARLKRLAPNALIHNGLSRPPLPDSPVLFSLYDNVRGFCLRNNLFSPGDPDRERDACINATITVSTPSPTYPPQPYLVMHPGSGSGKKNWPVENFIRLAEQLLALRRNGKPLFANLAVTAGEADGDLGETLTNAIPGASFFHNRPLEEAAGVLAGAALYIGNDSGISHLAGSVNAPDGSRPKLAVIFGPSSPRIWSPRHAFVLHAGDDMKGLPAAAALEQIAALLKD